MNELLSLDEIKERFPSEWVLIGNPQTDESLEILTGEVLFHSYDRDEVDRKLMELRPSHFALRYLGSVPEDMVLVL
jgi:hypothetical protein